MAAYETITEGVQANELLREKPWGDPRVSVMGSCRLPLCSQAKFLSYFSCSFSNLPGGDRGLVLNPSPTVSFTASFADQWHATGYVCIAWLPLILEGSDWILFISLSCITLHVVVPQWMTFRGWNESCNMILSAFSIYKVFSVNSRPLNILTDYLN